MCDTNYNQQNLSKFGDKWLPLHQFPYYLTSYYVYYYYVHIAQNLKPLCFQCIIFTFNSLKIVNGL